MSRTFVRRARPGEMGAEGVHLPGEAGLWVFILGDMVVFALFFGVFIVERSHHTALFDRSRGSLAIALGAANTLLLLTGSLFVVRALRAITRGEGARCRRWTAGVLACGAIFSIDKALEWAHLLSTHHGPETGDFYMYFFMFTAIHFLHLLIGMALMVFMWRSTRKPSLTARDVRALEGAAAYWHLVDLLWIVLFALLYLVS